MRAWPFEKRDGKALDNFSPGLPFSVKVRAIFSLPFHPLPFPKKSEANEGPPPPSLLSDSKEREGGAKPAANPIMPAPPSEGERHPPT